MPEPVRRQSIEQIVEHGLVCHWASNQISKAVADALPDYDRDIKALEDENTRVMRHASEALTIRAEQVAVVSKQAGTIKRLEAVIAAGEDMAMANEKSWDSLFAENKRLQTAGLKAYKALRHLGDHDAIRRPQGDVMDQYKGHTPGPWVYVNVGQKENCLIVGRLTDENDSPISQATAQAEFDEDYDCRLYTEGVCEVIFQSNDDPCANARLIADAPTLLAKYEEALRLLRRAGNALKARLTTAEKLLRRALVRGNVAHASGDTEIRAFLTPQEETVTPVSDVDELIGLVNRFGPPQSGDTP